MPGKTKTHRPATLDHLRKKKPIERTVPIILDDTPVKAVEVAKRMVATAPAEGELHDKAVADLEAAYQTLEESTVDILLRSIGRKRYDALLGDHPPTEEQKKEDGGENLLYNPETFPIALVAESSVEPKMTYEEAKDLFDEWNGAELSELFFAALAVNTQRRVVELGKDSGSITATGRN